MGMETRKVDIENEVHMDIPSADYLLEASNETVIQDNIHDLDGSKEELYKSQNKKCNCIDVNLCNCRKINAFMSRERTSSNNKLACTPVNEDMEMDDGVKHSEMKKEKKRHIPKSISFGRGAHRGFSRT